MRVHVIFFALAKELVGQEAIDVELPAGSTVADLRQHLHKQYPQLGDTLTRSMIAVDEEYAANHTRLSEGAEVACIPPVSGGQPLEFVVLSARIAVPASPNWSGPA